MSDFEYEAPITLAAAIELAGKHNSSARMLAGGTDLIDQVRVGRLAPDMLIDVKKIAELNVLEHSSFGLRLGAAVPCYQVYGHCGIVSDYAALADSCRIIGGVQIQSRASVGGNLCNSGPAADSIPSLIALEAVALIAGPKGRREVAVEDFCTGPGKNVLAAGELLVELKFPASGQQRLTLPPLHPPQRNGYRRRRCRSVGCLERCERQIRLRSNFAGSCRPNTALHESRRRCTRRPTSQR